MWIRWKYNDHGWPDWKELEIPDDLDGYESVEEYLCERNDLGIPTWSERFLGTRVKWERMTITDAEIKARRVIQLKASIMYHKRVMESAQAELDRLVRSDIVERAL